MGALKLALYSVVVFILIFVSIYYEKRISSQIIKDSIFISISLLTVLFHYIALMIEYITHQPLQIENTYYLPVYPCNIIMWINFLLVFLIPFKGKIFEALAGVSVFLGIPCGILGMCINFNFLSNPYFTDIYALKGLLSHATMIFCSIYLLAMGYIQIRFIKSMVSCVVGTLVFVICGKFTSYILAKLGQDPVNSMYFEPPFEQFPFVRFSSMVVFGLIMMACIFHFYEVKTLPLENRWYYPFIKNKNKKAI